MVTRYRINLEQAQYASSTINLRLAAIRRLAYEAADCGLLSPDLAAGIRRVKGVNVTAFADEIGDDWLTAADISTGPIFRAINKAKRIGTNGFSPKVIWGVVKAGSSKCGLDRVAPHDLRRYAECGMSVAHVPVCAMKLEGSWNRFSSSLAM